MSFFSLQKFHLAFKLRGHWCVSKNNLQEQKEALDQNQVTVLIQRNSQIQHLRKSLQAVRRFPILDREPEAAK